MCFFSRNCCTPLPLPVLFSSSGLFILFFPSALAVPSPTRCSFDHSYLLYFHLLCFHLQRFPLFCFFESLWPSSTSRSPFHPPAPSLMTAAGSSINSRGVWCVRVSTVVRSKWPPGSPGWHLKCTHIEHSHG